MSRPRSPHVEAVRRHLLERLQADYQFAGGRFPSARELAGRYEISYQTADRLLRELEAEGYLERRQGAGSFVKQAAATPPERALLVFNRRAHRPGSFGGELRHRLTDALEEAGIPFRGLWHDELAELPAGDLPVVWECGPGLLEETVRNLRFAVLLSSRPLPGLQATWVDSVSVDDFSGGVCAAQVLSLVLRTGRRDPRGIAILGGPRRDPRSLGRVAGFQSVFPRARVFHAETWFAEEAAAVAARMAQSRLEGLFCCNDRLAEAVLAACRALNTPPPRLVGFDDAPIARELGLSTVAIPWDGLVQQATAIIKRRLSGDAGYAAQVLLSPRPIQRWS